MTRTRKRKSELEYLQDLKRRKETFVNFSRFPIRVRAHCNPLADNDWEGLPKNPNEVDWKQRYPKVPNFKGIDILDVGCAFGGLLCTLSPLHPDKVMLGMEIRRKVVMFAQERIEELRQSSDYKVYNNVWVETNNVMRNLPNWIPKGQLEKIFFCFPDPHWKKKNHRRRIINENLLAEYAYVLKEGGMIYTVTDVEELGDWMKDHLSQHPLFQEISEEEYEKDEYLPYVKESSEDAVRTQNTKKSAHFCIFRKVTPA